jgi:murein DD-endopeptidase MepM/ murein hydrolase activator NlpD
MLLLAGNCIHSQTNPYPKDYFRSPLDIELSLSGNFGEIRPNHFHSGLDLRTQNKEGLKIYAVAEGYVSRIKVSPFGYGRALYITHPNGYVSVYGHLSAYSGVIADYVKKAQYAKESFEVELFPAKDELKVTKGQIVALSGNTGSSGGPHLHFEIRDEKTEAIINPLFFGFKVPDTVKPKIKNIAVYPLDNNSSVNGKKSPKIMTATLVKGKYSVKDSLKLSGSIGFAIETIDGENNSPGPNGTFDVSLYVDGEKVYAHTLRSFTFEQTRYVNAHIDYPNKRAGKTLQRSFLVKNNQLSIYHDVKNRGAISFTDSSYHTVKYEASDINGNTSTIELKVKSTPPPPSKTVYLKDLEQAALSKFDCTKESNYQSTDVKINIPADALYEDIEFKWSKSKDTLAGAIAPVHYVHDANVPVHKAYSLSIKTKQIPNSLQSKALIVFVHGKGKSAEGGEWADGWITTQTKRFGKFTVVLDTVAPTIKPVNILAGKDLSKAKSIMIKVSDDLTDIEQYRATIDGKWVLMEYEPKQALLYHTFDGLAKGTHTFKLEVRDEKGNASSYEAKFVR